MTPLFLSVVGAWLMPLLAADDTGDVLLKLLNLGAVGIGMFLLVRGDFRLKREVEAAEARIKEADNRAAISEARADREAENRQRMQDEMLTNLAPSLLKISSHGERMVEASTRNAELMEEVIRAFLREIKRT